MPSVSNCHHHFSNTTPILSFISARNTIATKDERWRQNLAIFHQKVLAYERRRVLRREKRQNCVFCPSAGVRRIYTAFNRRLFWCFFTVVLNSIKFFGCEYKAVAIPLVPCPFVGLSDKTFPISDDRSFRLSWTSKTEE